MAYQLINSPDLLLLSLISYECLAWSKFFLKSTCGVGPTNLLETTKLNKSDLLNLAFELIYQPEALHNKTIVAAKPKNEWKLLIGISKTNRLSSD